MKSEKGFSLVEVLAAMLLLGIVALALLGGLSTSSRAVFITDERATAESLARTEMEFVRSQDYSAAPWAYDLPEVTPPADPPDWYDDQNPPTLPQGYDGYIVHISAEGLIEAGIDNCIQKLTVLVYYPSDAWKNPDEWIVKLEGYRSMR